MHLDKYTRVKTHKLLQVCKQVVTSLFASCQQVVFALLVPSCCNKFGTSCEQLVTSLMALLDFVTRLFQQIRYSHDITRMLQAKVDNTRLQQYCYIMTVSDLLEQPCNKSDNINKVVTSC